MPERAPSACRRPGCRGLVRGGACSVCGSLRTTRDKEIDERRGSSSRRGYGRRWREVSALVLADHPWCAECDRHGRMALATDVHHKIPKRDGGSDDADNLEPLCHSCHSRITAAGG